MLERGGGGHFTYSNHLQDAARPLVASPLAPPQGPALPNYHSNGQKINYKCVFRSHSPSRTCGPSLEVKEGGASEEEGGGGPCEVRVICDISGNHPEYIWRCARSLLVGSRWLSGYNARLPPRPGHFRIFASGNRAGRCRWSAGFLGDLPLSPPLHSGAAPCSPPFTFIGSQDLAVNSFIPTVDSRLRATGNPVDWSDRWEPRARTGGPPRCLATSAARADSRPSKRRGARRAGLTTPPQASALAKVVLRRRDSRTSSSSPPPLGGHGVASSSRLISEIAPRQTRPIPRWREGSTTPRKQLRSNLLLSSVTLNEHPSTPETSLKAKQSSMALMKTMTNATGPMPHMLAEGLLAEGLLAEGLLAEGLLAEGLLAEGLFSMLIDILRIDINRSKRSINKVNIGGPTTRCDSGRGAR
ncbi:hypothetical protein PR048_024461 [Dryococelus australis]|uniref:Uncharacterized protein n=1 Tax=Dryococelus australis TaxID=614101 RepID=A0ABQ9GNQ1_9NEOP|nr:hypothetical protein PR048_024461 [Dryococelus australis]